MQNNDDYLLMLGNVLCQLERNISLDKDATPDRLLICAVSGAVRTLIRRMTGTELENHNLPEEYAKWLDSLSE